MIFLAQGASSAADAGLADEHAGGGWASRFVAAASDAVRLGNRHARNTRLAVSGPIGIAPQVRVEQVFEQRRGLLDEIHLNQMRAGLHRHAELQRLQDVFRARLLRSRAFANSARRPSRPDPGAD